jgi:hypothetical protein
MKSCFGMKSKKQQHKQKYSTLIKEPQFKRSVNNRSSAKHLTTTTVNADENIVNITTSSFYDSGINKSSFVTKSPSIWKRIFKREALPSK